MMTMLAIGMLANVCIDITEVRKSAAEAASVFLSHCLFSSWPMCGSMTLTMRSPWQTSS
jgi:hypothetical protein